MKLVTITALGGAIAIVTSLLFAQFHPFGDAGLYEAPDARTTIMEHASMPPEVRATLIAKCADCHSERVHAPLYGRLAPISWLVERDIMRGRDAMNLSRWESYGPDRQQVLAAKIVQETKSGKMPLLQYRMIHWSDRVTEADTATFSRWAHALQNPGDASMAPDVDGNPDRGKIVFEKRCLGCHALTQNREGPRLHGVYGRSSGSITGFPYSAALGKAHLTWNESTLEQWLTDPDALVPGNNMDFHVARPQERRDLIGFLRQEAGQ